ncbi:hypothetical protein BDV98DRAFT_598732 [Pterulicium gracile]|uniref:Uncharacterized protein n=1 Tax=Pterulicium gracile TaxID=1884261 RepID=A0A5C3QA09_9AGAR|nr:hypothetical protein BDV98DRAFT_598732 [Pterula gracilis]
MQALQYPACQTAATLDTEECIANSEYAEGRLKFETTANTILSGISVALTPSEPRNPCPATCLPPPATGMPAPPPTPPANTSANPPANLPAPPAAPPATSPIAAGDKEPESAVLSLQGLSALGLAVSAVAAVMIVL